MINIKHFSIKPLVQSQIDNINRICEIVKTSHSFYKKRKLQNKSNKINEKRKKKVKKLVQNNFNYSLEKTAKE
jgi:3-methyladenine DNA glycosylase AlkC